MTDEFQTGNNAVGAFIVDADSFRQLQCTQFPKIAVVRALDDVHSVCAFFFWVKHVLKAGKKI